MGLCIMREAEVDLFQHFLSARDALVGGGAVVDQRQLDVVQRRRAGKQIERLENEADLLIADTG